MGFKGAKKYLIEGKNGDSDNLEKGDQMKKTHPDIGCAETIHYFFFWFFLFIQCKAIHMNVPFVDKREFGKVSFRIMNLKLEKLFLDGM
ncbi:hypothetical protein ACIQZD_08365 [Peribacillus sp. NPDC096447]|uniref:hypothetical protein n=1 Tax=Peribacillus sp. NPDC096447 TaxID=3364394 RepID=UPI0038084FC0